MKRTIILLFAAVILIIIFPTAAHSYSERDTDIPGNEVYVNEKILSNAESVYDSLPESVKDILASLQINGVNQDEITALDVNCFAGVFMDMIKNAFSDEYISGGIVIGIILLCAMVNCFKSSENSNGQIFDIAAVMCFCAGMVIPISKLIESGAQIISDTTSFMTVYIPVMAGLMISSGQAVSGGAYYALMMSAAQICSFLCSKVIIPAVNIFFALSIVSEISPQMDSQRLCDALNKAIKWVLGFAMSIFASLFTLQGVVGGYSDNLSTRAAKFAVRSFVPVVGNALSDVYSTVTASVKLLKSGVGVVAVMGTGFIFLPVILKCFVWMLILTIGGICAGLFDLKPICGIIDVCSKTLSCFAAVLFSVMALFIISTAMVLVFGAG
ncbi:MAG: stage III sporulation protein AE [Clostridiales bacterium]|nr:stage III sporulation protein AE [Clostridiales bacterium]